MEAQISIGKLACSYGLSRWIDSYCCGWCKRELACIQEYVYSYLHFEKMIVVLKFPILGTCLWQLLSLFDFDIKSR